LAFASFTLAAACCTLASADASAARALTRWSSSFEMSSWASTCPVFT